METLSTLPVREPLSSSARRRRWRHKLRAEIAQEKLNRGGCVKCGYNEHPAALDFNHIDPSTKEFDVGSAVKHGHGRERIWAEMDKCEILCANCHRIHTYDTNNTRMGEDGA